MSVLQGGVMEAEALNDDIKPSWGPRRELCWDELSDTEKAARVAKRLLGPPKVADGLYMSVHAMENMWTGDPVTLDSSSNATKWNGFGLPHGIAMAPIGKGCCGWIQTKS